MRTDLRPGLSQTPEEPPRLGPVVILAGVLFVVMVGVVYTFGHVALLAVPAMASAHAVAMVVIYATTGALLLTYAKASGEVGYLVAAGTFFFIAGVMVVFSAAYPNAIVVSDPPAILWGGPNSAVALFHVWQLSIIVGLSTAALVIVRDFRMGRPPGLGRGLSIMWAVVGGALLLTAVVVGPLQSLLPALVDGITATPASKALFWLEALLAMVGVVLVGREARFGSPIARWMFAALVVTWGGAVASLAADRYSLAWYYNRVIGLVAALILLILLIRDIGRVERQILRSLGRDALTGVASREGVLVALDRQLRRAHHLGFPLSVLWVDLDGFQGINQRLGEQAGDEVLVEVARRITAELDLDSDLGRTGGDDFIVVVPGLDETATADLAERVLEAIRRPHFIGASPGIVTASIGLAGGRVPTSGDSMLFREAMVALQSARRSGGDRFHWYTEQGGVDAAERSRLRLELGQAIVANEFALEYQPIVDLRDGTVAGAEALVRWVRDGEVVPAGSFIGYAAESGLVVGIGRCVLDLLEERAPAILTARPAPFFVTFNLSVRELADDDIVARLTSGPLHARADRLIVEVTEEFELARFSGAADNLEKLRAAGYGLALDDFGSGFSNLSRLGELQPAIVKIDRGVVVQAGLGVHGGLVTLAAAVDIARALGATVLAEGMETNDEADVCIRLDVDLAQGYRFARSLGEGAFLAFCESRSVAEEESFRRRRQFAGDDAVYGPT